MRCNTDRLRAYLDEALPPQEQSEMTAHLETCAACRAALARLQDEAGLVTRALAHLDAAAPVAPDAARAWRRFCNERRLSQPTFWHRVQRSVNMMNKKWQMVAGSVMALLLLVGLFSLGPVRQAAADFLGIFRIRKFAVISVDTTQLDKLEDLGSLLESGWLGEPTVLREAQDLGQVATAAEASALAGFAVRAPQRLPDSWTAGPLSVATGPALRLAVERELAVSTLEAIGVQGVQLPDVAEMTIEGDVPVIVDQHLAGQGASIELVQAPSPTVKLPEGVDPTQLGQALLQVLGMPAEDARRVARTIDWTSTFVIPLPTNVASFYEVEVAGNSGLMLVEAEESGTRLPDSVLLWQAEGIVYGMLGQNVATADLLDIANSLR